MVKIQGDSGAQCWQPRAGSTEITSNQANRKGEVYAPTCGAPELYSYFQLKAHS